MSVKKYNLKKDGNKYISKNFQVKEFKCNDGSNTVYIDTKLVKYLQKARYYYNKPVHITSAYRTPSYNKKVGGVKSSYHTKGKAVDNYIKGVSVYKLARYYETLGAKGIGRYDTKNFIHLDDRKTKYYFINNGKKEIKVSTFYDNNKNNYPTLRKGSTNKKYIKKLQKKLNTKLKIKLDVDGIFGDKTYKAVKKFQKKNKLKVDGIVGPNTWNKLNQ